MLIYLNHSFIYLINLKTRNYETINKGGNATNKR
jgi:hypothetical protein